MKRNNFWKNKTVLLTGHTGFKGSWLTLILNNLGAKVIGYALNPISKPNFFDGSNLSQFLKKDYRANIKDLKKLKSVILTTSIKQSAVPPIRQVLKRFRDSLRRNLEVRGVFSSVSSHSGCPSSGIVFP